MHSRWVGWGIARYINDPRTVETQLTTLVYIGRGTGTVFILFICIDVGKIAYTPIATIML